MMPAWTNDYLNIPFKEMGRDRSGVDCYGLVRLVFQEQRGIELPSYTEEYVTTADFEDIRRIATQELAQHWDKVDLKDVQLFDGLILRIMGQPNHFGMVLDSQYFLHTMNGIWSVAERWGSLAWQHRVLGAVRYAE